MSIKALHDQNAVLFPAAGCYCVSDEDRVVKLWGKARCLWLPSEPEAEQRVKSVSALAQCFVPYAAPVPSCPSLGCFGVARPAGCSFAACSCQGSGYGCREAALLPPSSMGEGSAPPVPAFWKRALTSDVSMGDAEGCPPPLPSSLFSFSP